MTDAALVYPMFALACLTGAVLAYLFRSRVRAVRAGAVTVAYFRTFQGALEPEESVRPARHFSNLFEAPTLYYVACLSAMLVHDSGASVVALAWLYVVARAVHTSIHLGSNRLRHRIRAYFASWLVLGALWLHVVIHAAMRAAA